MDLVKIKLSIHSTRSALRVKGRCPHFTVFIRLLSNQLQKHVLAWATQLTDPEPFLCHSKCNCIRDTIKQLTKFPTELSIPERVYGLCLVGDRVHVPRIGLIWLTEEFLKKFYAHQCYSFSIHLAFLRVCGLKINEMEVFIDSEVQLNATLY